MAEQIWAQTFKYLADQKVLFEGMLLKPSMVTPGADSGKKVLLRSYSRLSRLPAVQPRWRFSTPCSLL